MKATLGITLILTFTLFSCNRVPEPCIEMDNTSVAVGTEITFTSCSKRALSYIWSFQGPDGAPENNLQWSEETFSRAFSVSGTYTVKLKAYQKYSWNGQNAETTSTFSVN